MRMTMVMVLTLVHGATNATGTDPAGMTSAEVPQYAVTCPAGATLAERCEVDRGTYAGWAFYSACG